MTLGRFDIHWLVWDEQNEAHVEQHISCWLIDEMIENKDFVVFPNSEGHPLSRYLIIGRTPSGAFVTAVLEPTAVKGEWRPITGWNSTPHEKQKHKLASTQVRSKQARRK